MASGPVDNTLQSSDENDSYPIKFKIRELAWLPLEQGISIHENTVWNNLSFTRDLANIAIGGLIKFVPAQVLYLVRMVNF